MQNGNNTSLKPEQVLIERVFDATPDLLFELWADEKHLANWYAPTGCTLEVKKYDFEKDGAIHMCIHHPQYGACWTKGNFIEIIPSKKIVYDLRFADADGNDVEDAAPVKHIDWPRSTIVTVSFTGENGKTRLTLHQTVDKAVAMLTGAYPSWLEMLDRLRQQLVHA